MKLRIEKDNNSRNLKESWWSAKNHKSQQKQPFVYDLYWVNWKNGANQAQK